MNLVNLKIKQNMYILHFNENTTISTYGDGWIDRLIDENKNIWIDKKRHGVNSFIDE